MTIHFVQRVPTAPKAGTPNTRASMVPDIQGNASPVAAKFLPFKEQASRALERGFLPTPLDGKRPMLNRWNRNTLTFEAVDRLVPDPKYAGANLGLLTGVLVVIDCDCTDAVLAAAVEAVMIGVLGQTSFVRSSRFPKKAFFFRCHHPVASARIGQVDILSSGKVIAAWGVHPKTGQEYYWPDQCILDAEFHDLPEVSPLRLRRFIRLLNLLFDNAHAAKDRQDNMAATPRPSLGRARDEVHEGERNSTLFNALRDHVLTVPSEAELRELAEGMNASFKPPLDPDEVARVCASVWDLRQQGRVITAKREMIVLPLGEQTLRMLAPDAFYLLARLLTSRPRHEPFTITQKGTASAFGWGSNRIKKAIQGLLDAGLLIKLPEKRACKIREAARYRFTGGTGRGG